ncbi:cadmium resistance transporter [Natronobiforma cellulositropha]|uniref:cadmium resistance transporter n=1 Tax=Natronobiforma cellulositropha TaxID=1679076 RepID=UPI0021D60F4A|nr:cadmium resistance transporter [Natronobiforma cellulositropha]
METLLLVGLWLFVVTNLDALLVVGVFCADNEYRSWEVFVGHSVGFGVGLVAAVVGAAVAAELFHEWTFLLGVLPLSIGLWGLFRRPPETTVEQSIPVPNAVGRVGVVTSASIGLSGENLAVYIPFFADLSRSELALVVTSYVIGAGFVFLVARLVVSRVVVDGISERLDRWLVSTVLVLVGGYVLVSGFAVA